MTRSKTAPFVHFAKITFVASFWLGFVFLVLTALPQVNAIAVPWAIAVSILTALPAVLFPGYAKRMVVGSLVLSFPICWSAIAADLYFNTPSLVGLWGGLSHMIWVAIFTALIVGGVSTLREAGLRELDDEESHGLINLLPAKFSDRISMGRVQLLVGLLALIAVFSCQTYASIAVGWGQSGAERFSTLPNVRIAGKGETLPPTDQTHIVRVSLDMAYYIGQSHIGANGKNYGSTFKLDRDDYVLQAVNRHLWWVCPFSYTHPFNQLGWLGNAKLYETPGYVMVDAENPDADPQIHDEHPMRYVPNAFWMHNLERHVYFSGYMHGLLDNITLEVNDDGHPYYTASFLEYRWTVEGPFVKTVLLIDAETGAITPYAPDKVPAWVDRVISKDLVRRYAEEWGKWHDPKSREQWPNRGGQFQMQPETADEDSGDKPEGSSSDNDSIEMCYNTADRPVWLIFMTSLSNSDASCTGVLLYDSNKNLGVFYPYFAGRPMGRQVKKTFSGVKIEANSYAIKSLQLYQIDGVATWVCIYGQDQGDKGSTYAGIGLCPADHVDVTNIVAGRDMASVLAAYQSRLAIQDQSAPSVASEAKLGPKANGKVLRVDKGTDSQGQPVTRILLSDDEHIYTLTAKTYPYVMFIEKGDQISIRYVDVREIVRTVVQVEDLTIKASMK